MRNFTLVQQLQRIDRLFQETRNASGNDLEMQAHWARYLCILSAGFLENAITEIYVDFVKRSSSEPVAKYTCAVLERIQNPQTKKFLETATAFKGTWGTELELFVNDEGRRDAINSIMANRHLIAHGRYSGITITRLRTWLDRSIEVLELIEAQCYR